MAIRKWRQGPTAPVDKGEYGPKMRNLPTRRMQRFALALATQDKPNYTKAYMEAGYRGNTKTFGPDASRLANDKRIQEAVKELSGAQMTNLLPMATTAMQTVLGDSEAKNADLVKAAVAVFDRSGMHAPTEHRVTVGLEGDPETLAQIRLLAEQCGIPLEKLLGGRLARQVEGEVIDVTPDVPPEAIA